MSRSVRFTSWYRDHDGASVCPRERSSRLHVEGTCTRGSSGSLESPPEGPEVLTIDGGSEYSDDEMDQIHENLEIDDDPREDGPDA